MTSLKLFGAALVVAALVAPASAQQAVQEPGAFEFYHPNADVLNAGVPTPSDAMAQAFRGDIVAGARLPVRHRVLRAPLRRH